MSKKRTKKQRLQQRRNEEKYYRKKYNNKDKEKIKEEEKIKELSKIKAKQDEIDLMHKSVYSYLYMQNMQSSAPYQLKFEEVLGEGYLGLLESLNKNKNKYIKKYVFWYLIDQHRKTNQKKKAPQNLTSLDVDVITVREIGIKLIDTIIPKKREMSIEDKIDSDYFSDIIKEEFKKLEIRRIDKKRLTGLDFYYMFKMKIDNFTHREISKKYKISCGLIEYIFITYIYPTFEKIKEQLVEDNPSYFLGVNDE